MNGRVEPANELASAAWDELQKVVARFEKAWEGGQRPTIAHYWPDGKVDRLPLLVELAHTDLEYRLKAGESARVEDYLTAYPQLGGDPAMVFGLITAEYELRRRREPDLMLVEYLQRFPTQRALLEEYQVGGKPADLAPLPNTIKQDYVLPAHGPAWPSSGASPPTIPGILGEAVAPDDTLPPSGASPPAIQGYEILGELGRGGMGVVYKARHLALKRVVALKMLLSGEYGGAAERWRFRAEAEVVARLHHPHIVQIYEVGEEGGKPFLALEYLEGGSLASKLAGTPLEPLAAARLVETLAGAMHYAHEQGVIHRDLKPGNVLLAADGTPKIADFGLARQPGSHLTATGAVLGTPSYMAPEQAQGLTEAVGPVTDVYALGALLYDLLTGRPPFKAATGALTVQQVLRDEPVPPRRLQPQTPRDLETVCLKCLQKAPARRYATAKSLAEDLERFLAGRPILARPVGRGERLGKWIRREPVAATLVATAFLLIASVLGGVSYGWRQAEVGRAAVEQQLYFNRIALADSNLSASKPAWAAEQLALCPEPLRQWEWHYLQHRLEGKPERILEGHGRGVSSVAASPDGTCIASASGDGSVRLWEVTTGRLERVLSGHSGSVNWVTFSPDGKTLASAGEDGRVIIWDRQTGEKRQELPAQKGPLSCVAFDPSGWEVAVSAFGGEGANDIHVWRVDSGEKIGTLSGHHEGAGVTGLAYSPDGGLLATASRDHTVRLWDTRTRKQRLVFDKHHFPVAAVAFNPDGETVASAAGRFQANKPDEGEIFIWSVRTGQVLRELHGHAGRPVALAFSPDGRRLATGAWDKEVKLWDVSSGQELLSFKGHRDAVMAVLFAGGGRYLVSGSLDRTVRIWDGSP